MASGLHRGDKGSVFLSQGWKKGMAYLYGLGAAVVIIGALFKILHLPGANEALIVGLSTEALIFVFSAFEPLPHEDIHYVWHKAYPQIHPSLYTKAEAEAFDESLIDTETDGLTQVSGGGTGGGGGGGGSALDAAFGGIPPEKLAEIRERLTPDLFISLSDTIKQLSDGVDDFVRMGESSFATDEFGKKIKEATSKVDKLSANYGATAEAMSQFTNSMTQIKSAQESISQDIKTYHQQVQSVTKNLSSLNAIYELEL